MRHGRRRRWSGAGQRRTQCGLSFIEFPYSASQDCASSSTPPSSTNFVLIARRAVSGPAGPGGFGSVVSRRRVHEAVIFHKWHRKCLALGVGARPISLARIVVPSGRRPRPRHRSARWGGRPG